MVEGGGAGDIKGLNPGWLNPQYGRPASNYQALSTPEIRIYSGNNKTIKESRPVKCNEIVYQFL